MVSVLRSRFVAAFLVATGFLGGCAQQDAARPRAESSTPASSVERLQIHVRSPAFEGTAFGSVGAYERVVGEAEMALDPRHAANQGIVDAALAASADGKVRYRTNVMILRPADAAKDSGVMVFEVANRGRKLALQFVNGGTIEVDKASEAGTAWLMRQGHTLLWVGWQGDVPMSTTGQSIGMSLPVAKQGGQPITGASVEEMVFDAPGAKGTVPLSYPAASTDQARATLSVKATPRAPARTLPASAWRYVNDKSIEVDRPADADAGAIYTFVYTARDPQPMGLGMAAVRDVVSFLKSGAPDASGQANPMAGRKPKTTVALGISQSGRFLRDWIWQGFNADPSGGPVFDGVMPTIAGSRKTFTNLRWAQPGRYSRQHEDHLYYGDQFPFTYGVMTDAASGRSDGIFARCITSKTCPKTIHLDSSLEYWQARAALVVTDGRGKDIALPDNVRAYLMASTQHGPTATPTQGICQRNNNPTQQNQNYRALMARLIEWTRDGKAPPPSRHPTVATGELVPPTAQAMGFPDLAALGMTVPAPNPLRVVDHSAVPPVQAAGTGLEYTVLVPRVDADGLDRSGIRLPDVAVPLATYTGWNQRREGFAPGQLCGLNGSMLPFAANAADRTTKRDPRPSVAERYATRAAYLQRVRDAAQGLQRDGLMLAEDVDAWMATAPSQPAIQALP
jgi:Alpha/beta hydrolase domain